MARLRVFCIDDDLFTLEYLEETLSERYTVGTCADASDAINRLVEFRADAVLLDLNMPHFEGGDVLALIRTFPDTRTLPVIALTGNADMADLDHLAGLGIRGLLEKGGTPEELIKSIETAVSKPDF